MSAVRHQFFQNDEDRTRVDSTSSGIAIAHSLPAKSDPFYLMSGIHLDASALDDSRSNEDERVSHGTSVCHCGTGH